MVIKQGKGAITLVCVVLGIMLAVQFRTTQNISSSVRQLRAEDLVKQLGQVENERDALLNEIRQLKEALGGGSTSAQLASINARAGFIPLDGPGVIVTMDDSKVPGVPGKNPLLFVIRDEDILKILNELWAAGAEAISINGQRLVASSEVRTAGNAILVNGTSIASPFVVSAIGEPETLENSLKLRGGVIETLQIWGIQISVKREASVRVPAYKGIFKFEHAKPQEEK
ncbi:DUF881 domain-containing protein [Anaeroselena agilis]|uniref:DUF881 domain-containing protein n=1 Tax=Anaeroselena agilis TaxID=3063788 RepID=A0ABU3NX93_9FIRM|nr:DUF881 domain-containing protein [Selenomonadales bacterium 4137-cl]